MGSALNAIRGPGVLLDYPAPLYPAQVYFSGVPNPGITGTNTIDLPAASYELIPSGEFNIYLGKYTMIQWLDPVTNIWRPYVTGPGNYQISADGTNYRVANLTGCPVGAAITNAGAGYTSVPTVSASGHNSTWVAVLGGYVSAVVAATSGTSYTMNPIVEIAAPPAGGVPATATAALSGSGLGIITVNNAGAGYVSTPKVTIVPNPLDPNIGTLSNATATATITGTGQVAAVLCLTNGSAVTNATVPTLVFAGGGSSTTAAATAIMQWTISSASVTTAGSGTAWGGAYLTALPVQTTGSTTAFAQLFVEQNMFPERMAVIALTTSTAGTVTAIGTIFDGGIYQTSAPTLVIVGGISSGTGLFTPAVCAITMGGVTDTVLIQPA